ncbi:MULTISPECIES: hypothetical protein [unclassified Streptomyces]|uniref:hypothetical protein n=1 Tax=unclassified Streptomyces TaxID=2593676 RepID=UPI002E3122FF|nr:MULTISPECIES: hypothetical protein [unclassified Streptomyces]WUC66051.1 hypothetical protein OG861_18400 [Streptomyces sp. NBC_00539]
MKDGATADTPVPGGPAAGAAAGITATRALAAPDPPPRHTLGTTRVNARRQP